MSKGAHLVGAAMMAALFVLAALAWAAPRAASSARLAGTVTVVKKQFSITNNEVVELVVAKCPAGTKVFGGGYASTGYHARVFVAGPSRGENGYILAAYSPPVNINTGVGKETAEVTYTAWCAKAGQPIVLPKGPWG